MLPNSSQFLPATRQLYYHGTCGISSQSEVFPESFIVATPGYAPYDVGLSTFCLSIIFFLLLNDWLLSLPSFRRDSHPRSLRKVTFPLPTMPVIPVYRTAVVLQHETYSKYMPWHLTRNGVSTSFDRQLALNIIYSQYRSGSCDTAMSFPLGGDHKKKKNASKGNGSQDKSGPTAYEDMRRLLAAYTAGAFKRYTPV